jgi:hypothetical protein
MTDGKGGRDAPPTNSFLIALGTIVVVAFGVALLASVVNLWPAVEAGVGTGSSSSAPPAAKAVRLLFGIVTLQLTPATALLVLVVIAGALGSMIHLATSFADFIGNRDFKPSWTPWYLVRPVVGAALALLLYFAVRGGFFSASSQSADVNPYGIAALAGLAGLFSKQATDKLREVFETLFHVDPQGGGAPARKDPLTNPEAPSPTVPAAGAAPVPAKANPIPAIVAIEPPELHAGAHEPKVKIHGQDFAQGARVRVNEIDQATAFASGQELSATLTDDLLAAAGPLSVTVVNGKPGGGESPPHPLPVVP